MIRIDDIAQLRPELIGCATWASKDAREDAYEEMVEYFRMKGKHMYLDEEMILAAKRVYALYLKIKEPNGGYSVLA